MREERLMKSSLILTEYTVSEGDTVKVKRTGELGIVSHVSTRNGQITFSLLETNEIQTVPYQELNKIERGIHSYEIFHVGHAFLLVSDCTLSEEIQKALTLNGAKIEAPRSQRFQNGTERTMIGIYTGQVVDEHRSTHSDVAFLSMTPYEQQRYEDMQRRRITQYNLAVAHDRLYHIQNTDDGWDSFVVLQWANL